ncbi:MAG: hypothetical protein AB8F74_16960 [Saprospiraceae bacterium]
MKKLNLLILLLLICVSQTYAQIEIKTSPLNLLFVSKIPDLYVEHPVSKRIGIEYGISHVDHCIDFIYCSVEEKGIRGLLAAKHYLFEKRPEGNFYLGLYVRPQQVELKPNGVLIDIENELTVGTGIMAGYKVIGRRGFVMEASFGAHSYDIIKTGERYSDNPYGPQFRLMIGYRFNRNKN